MDNKEKEKEPKTPQQAKPRQIVIEFDAQQARITNGQIASNFELIGILESLLKQVKPK